MLHPNELIIDNFAGGGGASEGMEQALGRPVDIAINHDIDAIRLHKANHPNTRHLCENVWDVDPMTECGGRPVGLAWFSPDCKHFSKAKGGKPVDRSIRGLSWIVLRWGLAVPPRIIVMENVEEIQTWGPLLSDPEGGPYPDPKRKGETFKGFIAMLTTGIASEHPALTEACGFLGITKDSPEAKRLIEGLGYTVEWRELVAADYGTPTIRKRFFLIARRDGKPIVWPEATHSKNGKNGLPKWRGAHEIIDWTLPCPSIFDTKAQIKTQYGVNAVRPLADNTMRRIVRGIDRFMLKSGEPFIVQCNHAGGFRGQSAGEPLQTTTGKNGYGVVTPTLTPYCNTPFIVPVGYGERKGQMPRVHDISSPLPTSVSSVKHHLCTPILAPFIEQCKFNNSCEDVHNPLRTVTSVNAHSLIAPALIQYHTEQNEYVRGQSITNPIMTIDGSDRYGLAVAFMSKFYGTCIGHSLHEPLHTVTTSSGHFGEVRTHLAPWDGKQDLGRWPEVRRLLNAYCDYNIPEDSVLLLEISGILWFITDIGLRMLTPRELFNANGFPSYYIIARDCEGKVYGKSLQVARCGNAVPPPFAKAIVTANCGGTP